MAEGKRIAVVLFNLGGPDKLESVKPFLFNLFNDGAIIALPALLRWPAAKLISRRRAPVAREIYRKMGGGPPLLANTEAQAQALEAALRDIGSVKAFIAMRYWAPFSDEAAAAVRSWDAERVVLLPLYPQFSTTTTASSWTAWRQAAARVKLQVPTTLVCCYPRQAGLVKAVAELVSAGLAQAGQVGKAGARPRVLFSAHGLPQTIVAGGDPYQWQVEQTCAAVIEALGRRDLDSQVCYQSRVGPLEWIGPSTEKEIERAGRERVRLVVVPIAFVSEHSETLVELDIEYEALARRVGVPAYVRVPTVSILPHFIAGLAALVREALAGGRGICPGGGTRLCPAAWGKCPMAAGGPEP
ncbi:MAG: ferrochelatase [Alphaproteobacteria bacterium]